MFPRVTAILVVHRGGDRLRRSLDALRAQRRTPDALVVVLMEPDAEARELVAAAGPTHIVELAQRLSFGEAVRAGERVVEAPSSDADALWLLAGDTAPEPAALETLITTLETAKSVAVAGPKLMEWDSPDRIATFGRSVTRLGRAVTLVEDELDQGQHDSLSDVLGLDPAAILVRHTVWRALDGFDQGLPTADDALDFSIRARLAGHRVAVVPEAKVSFAADGVAGPPGGTLAQTVRRRGRAARAAALHRRLVYAPVVAVPVHWLTFLPLALLRSVRLLLVKSPGAIPGEFSAALGTMFSSVRVARARRTLKAARTVGWSSIAPLRMQPDEMRRRQQQAAEARRARARGRQHELRFLGSGGGWVLLASVAASVALFSWLIGASGLRGGGILPLSGEPAVLWRNAAYGWRDVGAGFVGAADPFAGVLAVLGSIAFWTPSFALVLLWLLAVPAAALGAWLAASRLTERGSLRAVAAALWAVAPSFLTALGDGRPGAVIAHVLLAWLAFAVFGAATSWAAAATASLLFAAVIAAAPSLAPALIIAWIVALAVSGRGAARLAALPLPAAVLAAPLVITQIARGTPLALVADPGLPLGSTAPTTWQLALGFPGSPWGDWSDFLGASGVDPRVVLTALVAPLAVAAIAAVLVPGIRSAAARARSGGARLRHRGRRSARRGRHRRSRGRARLDRTRSEPRVARPHPRRCRRARRAPAQRCARRCARRGVHHRRGAADRTGDRDVVGGGLPSRGAVPPGLRRCRGGERLPCHDAAHRADAGRRHPLDTRARRRNDPRRAVHARADSRGAERRRGGPCDRRRQPGLAQRIRPRGGDPRVRRLVRAARRTDRRRCCGRDRRARSHRPRRQRGARRGRRDRLRFALALRRRRTGCPGRPDPGRRRRLARGRHHTRAARRDRRRPAPVHPHRRRARSRRSVRPSASAACE